MHVTQYLITQNLFSKNSLFRWGTRVAQLVERPTLDFGSGHDVRVMGGSPGSGSAVTPQRLLGILSLPLSLSAPPPLTCLLSLSKGKCFLKKKKTPFLEIYILCPFINTPGHLVDM